jgi:hypothetical protein
MSRTKHCLSSRFTHRKKFRISRQACGSSEEFKGRQIKPASYKKIIQHAEAQVSVICHSKKMTI